MTDRVPKGEVEILVTDGHTRSALAVVRSLMRRGRSFVVLCPWAHSLVFYSRDVKYAISCPNPLSQPNDFVCFVLKLVRDHGIRLLIPMTDLALVLFERHREDFERHTRLAMAGSCAIRRLLDKREQLALASSLAVPCPRQFRFTSTGQIPEMIQALGFPIVIKRSSDPVDRDAPTFPFTALYAFNEAELRRYIEEFCLGGEDPLFQEYVKGNVYDLCCFAAHGKLLAIHTYHALRRFNGNAALRKIVPTNQKLESHARSLLAALDWDGVAHVSFFVDETGQAKYMETNGRFWASVQGSIYAGWDFPDWTCEYFLHDRLPQPRPIAVGDTTCWHVGDLLALLKFVARAGASPTPDAKPSPGRAALQFLSGFRPGIHPDLFRWHDPLPALIEPIPYCKRAIEVIRTKKFSYAGARRVLFPSSPAAVSRVKTLSTGNRATGQ